MADLNDCEARFMKLGDSIDYTPVGALTAGDLVVYGARALVVAADIEAGKLGALNTRGVYRVRKANADTFAEGVNVDWDDTANEIVATTAGDAHMGIIVEDGGVLTSTDYALVMLTNSRNP